MWEIDFGLGHRVGFQLGRREGYELEHNVEFGLEYRALDLAMGWALG